ncbi:MAG: hypothetical protein WAU49_07490 [Steroidobacteraceae bacterium]
MIRRSVVLVAMLCASGMAFAQTPPSGTHADWQAKRQQWHQKMEQMHAKMEQKRLDRLAVLLDMTSAQKQQVQTIFSAEHDQMKQAMQQAMAARKAAHKDAATKLGQVLSPTQLTKLKLLMPHRHHFFRMRGRMGMHGHMGPMGHMGKGGPMGWQHGAGSPPPPAPGAGSQ